MKLQGLINKKGAVIIVLIVLTQALFAGTGSLKGIVTDNIKQQPIPQATISLLKANNTIASMKTNNKGAYYFANLKDGIYTIEVTAKDYKKEVKKNIIIKTSEVSTHNFTLISTIKVAEPQVEPEPIEVKTEPILFIEEDEAEEEVEMLFSIQSTKAERAKTKSYNRGYSTRSPRKRSMMGNGGSMNDSYGVVHNTESYDVINENSFKEVKSDPLSTFSIDVDKASYSNVRRMINYNQMPNKDAVRIEELINYFDYDYKQPKDDAPFSTVMEYGECPWNTNHQLALIGIKGKEIATENVPASNIVFLIDVSGSMGSPNKLGLLKKAFKLLVDNLRPQDKVAIVVYAGAAGEVLPATSGNNKKAIMQALDRLQSGGSTAGGAGIELAYKIAQQNFVEGGNNRVILATDGDFNVGSSSNADMVRLIEKKRESGVFLTVLGFGMGNYKDSKMEQLSNAGNGNYAYIDNILEAKKMFGTELWGTLFTIAKDVKIQVEFNPAKVKAYRLIGYENRLLNKEDFNDDKKDAGEIGCGHTVTALYEIIPADSDEVVNDVDDLEYQKTENVKSNNLMTLKLRYKQPDGNKSKLITKRIKESDINKVTDNFYFAASVAEFGMLLRDSEFKKDATFEQALALAKQAKGKDIYGYRSEFITLVEKAQLLAK